jgi:hypothetical protein
LAPLFGHSMAWPPEAAASFTTTKGENRLWSDRLSSSTTSEVPPAPELLLEDEELLELLDEDELLDEPELDELLLDEEEELLELDELDEELELLLEEDELLELEELELLEVSVSPTQAGAAKVPV